MNATHEEWRPVVGYEGSYEVSSLGRVRSLDRIIVFPDGRQRRAPGRILKPWLTVGYPTIKLPGESRKVKAYIHALVLEAFVGPRPDGMTCCHGDGDRRNNSVENLRWGSYSDNNRDLVRHGTHFQASKTHCPHGHEYSSENTTIYAGRGYRERLCRTCQRRHQRNHKAKRRALMR